MHRDCSLTFFITYFGVNPLVSMGNLSPNRSSTTFRSGFFGTVITTSRAFVWMKFFSVRAPIFGASRILGTAGLRWVASRPFARRRTNITEALPKGEKETYEEPVEKPWLLCCRWHFSSRNVEDREEVLRRSPSSDARVCRPWTSRARHVGISTRNYRNEREKDTMHSTRRSELFLPGGFHSSHFGAWDKIVDGFVLLILVVLSDDHLSLSSRNLSLENYDKQMLIDIDQPSLHITLVWFLSNIETPSRSSCPTEMDKSILEKQSDRSFEDLQEENRESSVDMDTSSEVASR